MSPRKTEIIVSSHRGLLGKLLNMMGIHLESSTPAAEQFKIAGFPWHRTKSSRCRARLLTIVSDSRAGDAEQACNYRNVNNPSKLLL